MYVTITTTKMEVVIGDRISTEIANVHFVLIILQKLKLSLSAEYQLSW